MPRLTLSGTAKLENAVRGVLKKGMIDKGWSNQHLAKLLNMYPGNLSKAINHPLTVKFETICKIAEKLGIKDLPIK